MALHEHDRSINTPSHARAFRAGYLAFDGLSVGLPLLLAAFLLDLGHVIFDGFGVVAVDPDNLAVRLAVVAAQIRRQDVIEVGGVLSDGLKAPCHTRIRRYRQPATKPFFGSLL